MKISEFAIKNQVTAKMLRHYDEIGLLKPNVIDPDNGYRLYSESQCQRLNWILILKNLDFSLNEIRTLLDDCVDQEAFIKQLIQKRIEINQAHNEQILKRIQIDRLIQLIELEGFSVEKKMNLLELTEAGVHEVKKYIPNTEMFLENAQGILKTAEDGSYFCVIRTDLRQFKMVNDIDGYEVGDKVIVAFYQAISEAVEGLETHVTIGRAGGDEFTVLAVGRPEQFQIIGGQIVENMRRTDFKALGCHKQVKAYVSGLWAPIAASKTLRTIIDETYETLIKAKNQGDDAVLIEAANLN